MANINDMSQLECGIDALCHCLASIMAMFENIDPYENIQTLHDK